jgi:exosortase/archaeosortase family protein
VNASVPRLFPFREQPLRFVVKAATLMAVTYAILYFPYPGGSLPVRVLTGYLRLIARLSAVGVSLFDHSVVANGDLVLGRFSLRIVLDCAALDAHALFASAVLAFPAPWRQRLLGVGAGAILLGVVNLGRIVSLYAIGLFWPGAFDLAHEELFQFGLILAAFVAFWRWIRWARASALP